MSTIALCLIARNEERFLTACLESARDAVDQMIVVDTGSSDRTVEIAREAGALVVEFPWQEDFAAARNAALPHVKTDWVLVLDADEQLCDGAALALRRAVQGATFDVGMMPLHNADSLDAGREAVLQGHARLDEPILLPRLLRYTPDLAWTGVVHETIGEWVTRGRRALASVDVPIVHYGAVPALRDARDKAARNLRLLERRCLIAKEDVVARTYLARELIREGRTDRAEKEIETAWAQLCAQLNGTGPTPSVVPLFTLRAHLALQNDDPQRALDSVQAVRDQRIAHPNIDLLEGAAWSALAAQSTLDTQNQALVKSRNALIAATKHHGKTFADEVLPGATSWAASTQLGNVLLAQGQWNTALQVFEASLTVNPQQPTAVLGRTEAQIALNEPTKGLSALEPFLAGENSNAWLLAAVACIGLGAINDAKAFFERAQRAERRGHPLAPHRESVKRALALQLTIWSAAQSLAIALNPVHLMRPDTDTATRLVTEGEQAFAEGDHETASQRFIEAIGKHPVDHAAWNNLGVVRYIRADLANAEIALNVAREIASGTEDTALNLANIQIARDHLRAAVKTLRAAPADEQIADRLASLGIEGEQPPKMLLLGHDPTQKELTTKFRRAALKDGFRPTYVSEDVLSALLQVHDEDLVAAADYIIKRTRPDCVVASLQHPLARTISERLAHEDVRLLTSPTSLPHVPRGPYFASWKDDSKPEPLISVIVPTQSSGNKLVSLLDEMALQDIDPDLFEVMVVSTDIEPTATTKRQRPFSLTVSDKSAGNVAQAKNLAAQHAQGRLLIFLTEAAAPNSDHIRSHLIAHFQERTNTANPIIILGATAFEEHGLEKPFMSLMQESKLLIDYRAFDSGCLVNAQACYGGNVSFPRRVFSEAQGFDTAFASADMEWVEFIARAQKEQQVEIKFRPDLSMKQNEEFEIEEFQARAFQIGKETFRLYKARPDLAADLGLPAGADATDDAFWLRLRPDLESQRPKMSNLVAQIQRLQQLKIPSHTPEFQECIQTLERLVAVVNRHEYQRGLVEAWSGFDTDGHHKRLMHELTSVVIPNLNGFPHIEPCLNSLREHTNGPVEVIIIDNGSTDGSLEWLRTQRDITLIEMSENVGAPAARNRGLEIAHGETILFSDNDVIFTPNWREILVGHLEQWPDVGLIGPMSDNVTGLQQTQVPEDLDEDLAGFARAFSNEVRPLNHAYTTRLILFFMMVRREVIDKIGGFDEGFGMWGFEDDDYSVRARCAGYRLRIAMDCFIRHLGSQTSRTARLDYTQLLLENFEYFKKKWGLPQDLPYGPVDFLSLGRQAFNVDRDVSPIEKKLDESLVKKLKLLVTAA